MITAGVRAAVCQASLGTMCRRWTELATPWFSWRGTCGRRADGLPAAQQAADLYRELATAEPDIFGERAANAEALAARLTAPSRRWPRLLKRLWRIRHPKMKTITDNE